MKDDPCGALYFDSFVYRGPFCDDCKHGSGSISSADGSNQYIFDGEFQNDKKDGLGQLCIKSLKKGTQVVQEEKYSGQYKNDQYHGSGVHVNSNGDVYDGEFMHGQRHGLGNVKINDEHKEITYLGEFKNGRFHGKG
jgi:hypothetical protein